MRKVYSEEHLVAALLPPYDDIRLYGDTKEDIIISENELNTLISRFCDNCKGKYRGGKKICDVPGTIYGDGETEAISCRESSIFKIADYPRIMVFFDRIQGISQDQFLN